jgi:hypothetical protein
MWPHITDAMQRPEYITTCRSTPLLNSRHWVPVPAMGKQEYCLYNYWHKYKHTFSCLRNFGSLEDSVFFEALHIYLPIMDEYANRNAELSTGTGTKEDTESQKV